jgi:ElaB/YqjD/DUF883 family membrane-anchored ribosome-binding protein
MAVALTETHAGKGKATTTDRVTDGVRQAAHFSHQVRLMKSMARDAGEEGVHAAKRAMKRMQRGLETLEDFRDEAVHRVKREPVKALGIAVGSGLLIGAVLGWIASREARKWACRG